MKALLNLKAGKLVEAKKPLTAFRKFGASEKTAKFLRWLDAQYPFLEIDERTQAKQVVALNAYFALQRGEGKTFLAKALVEYDRFNG